MGRPYTDGTRKSGRFELRTTPEEEEKLKECCEKLGKTRADIIRLGLSMVYDTIK
jgi:predicted DNA-binding protein